MLFRVLQIIYLAVVFGVRYIGKIFTRIIALSAPAAVAYPTWIALAVTSSLRWLFLTSIATILITCLYFLYFWIQAKLLNYALYKIGELSQGSPYVLDIAGVGAWLYQQLYLDTVLFVVLVGGITNLLLRRLFRN